MSGTTKQRTLSKIFPAIAAAISVLAWGLSFVSTKVIMEEGQISPTEAFIYRFTLAWLIVIIIWHKRLWCDNIRDELTMLICGLSAGSLYFIAENTALQLTLTANVSLLTSTSPLLTVFLVGFFYKSEKPAKGMIIGSLVAFAGVVCVIFNSFTGSLKINPVGDLLSIGAALGWAFYSIILKRLDAVYDALFITRKVFFYGVVTAIPFLFLEKSIASPLEVLSNTHVLYNLLFLAIGASILGFYLWAVAVNGLGSVKANNFLYFQSIVTLIAAAVIFDEHINIMGYIGTALILIGLWLSDYLQRKHTFRHQTK